MEKWSKGLCPIPGGSSPDSGKIKILSKHLLPQFRVREFFSKSKSHSSLSTMQAWFPTGELIHGCGSCPPTSLPTGFSEWGLNHISHAWNGSPQNRSKRIHLHQYSSERDSKWTALRKGRKRERKRGPQVQKMAMNKYLSIITLNVNGLNALIKRHK